MLIRSTLQEGEIIVKINQLSFGYPWTPMHCMKFHDFTLDF